MWLQKHMTLKQMCVCVRERERARARVHICHRIGRFLISELEECDWVRNQLHMTCIISLLSKGSAANISFSDLNK